MERKLSHSSGLPLLRPDWTYALPPAGQGFEAHKNGNGLENSVYSWGHLLHLYRCERHWWLDQKPFSAAIDIARRWWVNRRAEGVRPGTPASSVARGGQWNRHRRGCRGILLVYYEE